MKCPKCGHAAQMKSPDYGRGAEFVCYRCYVYGARFVSSSPEALAESAASRALSRANAREYAASAHPPDASKEDGNLDTREEP